MIHLTAHTPILMAIAPADFRRGIGTPGKAWCFQWVTNPIRARGEAASPEIESCAYEGNDISEV